MFVRLLSEGYNYSPRFRVVSRSGKRNAADHPLTALKRPTLFCALWPNLTIQRPITSPCVTFQLLARQQPVPTETFYDISLPAPGETIIWSPAESRHLYDRAP